MEKLVRFGDLFELERHPLAVDPTREYVQIGIKSFGHGIFHRPPVLGDGLSKLKYFHVYPGRIIFSNIMAWEGAVALSGPDEKGTVGSQRFLSYRPRSDDAHLPYVNYFFQSEAGRELLASGSTGTVKRNQTLSPATIENFLVPLPDIDEQRRIATKLDACMTRVERVEELDKRAGSYARALLESFFNESWPERRAGEVLRLDRSPISIVPEDDYRAIGIRSFGKGMIRYPPVSGADLSKLRYFRFPEGALALSNIKAWEGAVTVTGDADAGHVASNRFLFYVPRDPGEVDVNFLCYYLIGKSGLSRLGHASPGSADRNRTLSMEAFERMLVPVPEIAVQRRISTALDKVFAQFETFRNRQAEISSALRPALLNAAFGGRLRSGKALSGRSRPSSRRCR